MHFMPHKMREFITDRANISCSGCANLSHANLRLSKNEYHVNLTISKGIHKFAASGICESLCLIRNYFKLYSY